MVANALPPIPESIDTAMGPVSVVMVENLTTKEGDYALGLWWPENRCIKLCAGLSLVTAWATLEHERVHQILWDAGTALVPAIEERVCDAIATARVAAMLRG
jgi:hypothetical protein